MIWEVYSLGSRPYGSKTITCESYLKLISRGERLKTTDNMPNWLCIFLDRCWKINPDEHPTFAESNRIFKTHSPIKTHVESEHQKREIEENYDEEE